MRDKPISFALLTLGCKVNQQEGESVAAVLIRRGYERLDFGGVRVADIYIINTCAVTKTAESKSKQIIRRAAKKAPKPRIMVMGCYSQMSAQAVASIDGVDMVLGNEEKAQAADIIAEYIGENRLDKIEFDTLMEGEHSPMILVSDIRNASAFRKINPVVSRQSRSRAYLKVEDGCEQYCSYCIVPYVRGPVRSMPVLQAVEYAEGLLAEGHKEIVLSGINIGAYGFDCGSSLDELLCGLLKIKGGFRLRLSSVEPQQITDNLIELIAFHPKICRHLHIPLQSGCDHTLAAMGRRYDIRFFKSLIENIRNRNADIAVSTDIMVGYPGETEDDFNVSCGFVRETGFASIHVFPYSARDNTYAATITPQIVVSEKHRRAAIMAEIARNSAQVFREGFMGKTLEVLEEKTMLLKGEKYSFGHSDNYLPIAYPMQEDRKKGFDPVKIVRAGQEMLFGNITDETQNAEIRL